ncbi:MAG: hypothetical protein AAF611_08465 [Bacteroidota bacterium]
MKKSFFGICAMALFALAFTSNSFDNSAFTADTVASLVTPTINGDMDLDGRNSATISVNGTSASISGSGSISVTSEGGTGSGSITTTSTGGGTSGGSSVNNTSSSSSTTTSSTTTSSTTTSSGGSGICAYISSSYLRSLFGCD